MIPVQPHSRLTAIVGTSVQPLPETAELGAIPLDRAVVDRAPMTCKVAPQSQAELSEVIRCAHDHHWPMLVYGQGSKLDWGGLVKGATLAVTTQQLTRLIDHAIGDMTVTVEAGMPFTQLQAQLAESGQWLPLDPILPEQATIGGIVATANTGSLRHRYGGVRDLLIGIQFVRADGEIVKAGGRVVKNVAGYDLMKLLTGSYGTLGVISQVTLRTYPLPETSQTVWLTGAVAAMAELAQTLLASSLTPIAVDWVSPALVTKLQGKGDLGLIVQFQGLAASVQEQSYRVLELGSALGVAGQVVSESAEQALWQQLRDLIQTAPGDPGIHCKMGMRATGAIAVLTEIDRLLSDAALAVIHAGSGLGTLRGTGDAASAETILALRQRCQAEGGFLTVLQASNDVKQALDPWGYTGNALELMRRLKHQFDPQHILNPRRFVGQI